MLNKTKYLFRLDDITPSMNWNYFWKYIDLFSKYGVKPLLGIVPDNRDKSIEVDQKNKDFWKIISELVASNRVDIAQHGYQHILFSDAGESLPFVSNQHNCSEFSGLSKDDQYSKILSGKKILDSYGLQTNIWMSPAHTMDDVTVDVLKELGFTKVTDGNTLFPFKYHDLLFIPQQFEKPRKMPFGFFTFCIHINGSSDHLYKSTERLLRLKDNCYSFGDLNFDCEKNRVKLINRVFQFLYNKIRTIKSIISK